MKKDLSVVVVNYNTGGFLAKAVESVVNSDLAGISWEIVVVDNASFDESIDDLRKLYSDIGKKQLVLVENKENLGFARANNVGIKNTSGELVLFLNPDTTLEKSSLKQAVSFMRSREDAGAVAINMRLPSGEMDEAMHRGFPTPWNAFCFFSGLARLFPQSRWFSGYVLGWKLKDKSPHEIEAGSGAFMLVRWKAGEEVGWWDEDYYWNGEDVDFYYRLNKAGWKSYFLPEACGIHYRGVSSGVKEYSRKISKASRETRIRAATASCDAMIVFYRKHYLSKSWDLVTRLVFLGISLLRIVRLMKAKWF